AKYQAGGDNGEREAAVRELLEAGHAGCNCLTRIAMADENPDSRRQLYLTISLEAGRAIPALSAENKFTAFEELLDLCLGSLAGAKDDPLQDIGLIAVQNYTLYWKLRGKLDDTIAKHKTAFDKKPSPQTALVLVYLCRAKGDRAATRAYAEKAE